MKKLWLFPMIFFILILLAGGFRWGKGPLQNAGDYQVMHMKDHWTGQRWIILFGGLTEMSNHQKTEPYPLYSGEWVPYLTQKELDIRMETVLGQSAYQSKWRTLEQRIKGLEAQVAGVVPVPEGETEAARQALYEATWELDSLYAEAKQVLLTDYKAEAKKRELLATVIWGFLLVLTFGSALHYFLVEVKRWKQVNETYEIVEYVTKNHRYPLGK